MDAMQWVGVIFGFGGFVLWLWICRGLWRYASRIEARNAELRALGWVWLGHGNLWTGPILTPPWMLPGWLPTPEQTSADG